MTKLIFLGTKGEIEESTEKHQYHSSLLLISQNYRLLIDHGMIHKMDLTTITPDGILVTHAHPDHYIWLNEEVNIQVPVYLTNDTYNYGKYKPSQSNIIKPGIPFQLGPFNCLAYQVIHSLRCPTVGYKIYVEGNKIAYNPDLIDIINKDNILYDVSYYVGDGSAIRSNLVRRRANQLFGHTRIITQINWCHKFGIKNIVFTHLGKEIITKEEELTKSYPEIILAYDGMELII